MHWIPPKKPAPRRPSTAPRGGLLPRFATPARQGHGLTLLQATVAVASAISLAGTAAAADTLVDGSQILARYTTVPAAPEASRGQPLAVIATVHFPRATVSTVGDALQHLLARTGYTLVPAEQLDPVAAQLLNLSLPESQRALGPYRVDAMVRVLLGDGWTLQIDPLLRRIAFAPASVASAPTASAAAADTLAASTQQVQP